MSTIYGNCNTLEVDDTVTSIVETSNGCIRVETIGETLKNHDDSEDFTVLYQRGLLANPTPIKRTHRNLLSNMQIKSGENAANVPWKNFAWNTTDKRFEEAQKSSCMCLKPHCTKCYESVTEKDVKVVWMNDEFGITQFQWYVKFSGDDVLVRIPHRVVMKIKYALTTEPCRCGNCKHPLTKIPCEYSNAKKDKFDKDCVRVFNLHRVRVTTFLSKQLDPFNLYLGADRRGTKRRWDDITHKGTCVVCLEETHVSVSTCVKKLCSIELCSDCHTKTRGLCPICDRTKLSEAALFQCGGCNRVVELNEYGHECIWCKKPELCIQCYKAFGQCPKCEHNMEHRRNS